MNGAGDLPLVKSKHLPGLVLRQIGTQMSDDLPGEVVKQVRMLVGCDVWEVNQPADDVVLQPLLEQISLRQADNLDLVGAEIFRP
jgi:hypothetical protein